MRKSIIIFFLALAGTLRGEEGVRIYPTNWWVGMKNPNLQLLHELKMCGVEIFVCGQSLARNKFTPAEVGGDVTVAVSAMTVNANKQLDGYAYLSIP